VGSEAKHVVVPRDPLLPMTMRQLYRVVRETAEALEINKRVSLNVLRHFGRQRRRTPSSPPSRAISHAIARQFHKISPHLLLERTGSSQPLPLTPISRTSAAPSAPAQSP
jgi:hypothetical protein